MGFRPVLSRRSSREGTNDTLSGRFAAVRVRQPGNIAKRVCTRRNGC